MCTITEATTKAFQRHNKNIFVVRDRAKTAISPRTQPKLDPTASCRRPLHKHCGFTNTSFPPTLSATNRENKYGNKIWGMTEVNRILFAFVIPGKKKTLPTLAQPENLN